IDTRLKTVENKVDAVDTRLKTVENKVDAVDTRLKNVENKVDENLANHEKRITKLEEKVLV
ncbi:MAG: hypothetical protein Q7S07_05090, partial [Candidatus Omnitrophota bacterium]|nr:hypothetical protein [Candidatus Omnitrophota bacterium]